MTTSNDNTHRVYAVYFADGRIKVGVSANVRRRMSYYAQEARRNRIRCLTWWACAPMDKGLAFLVERHFCREMRGAAMTRHREWFEGDAAAYAAIVPALERLRASVAVPSESVVDLPWLGIDGHVVAEVRA